MKGMRLGPHWAFTLIELLIVIWILAILAAMLFPVSRSGPVRLRVAEVEMAQISNAIHQYEFAYGKLPVTKSVIEAAAKQKEDFTYGTYGLPALRAPGRRNISIISPGATKVPAEYQTNNAEPNGGIVGFRDVWKWCADY